MISRIALIFALAFGLTSFVGSEAQAGHHEAGEAQADPSDPKQKQKEWSQKRDKEWKKDRKEKQLEKKGESWERRRADRGEDSDSGSESSVSESSVSEASHSEASRSEDSRSEGSRSAGSKKATSKDSTSREERAELRASEEPGAWGRMRRFFGFERAAERRSESGAEHERASDRDRGPAE